MRRNRSVAFIVVSALLMSGCSPWKRVTLPDSTPSPPNAAVFAELKAGDAVRVTTRTGSHVTFTVATVQADGILATDGRWWHFRDMTNIEKKSQEGAAVATWTVIGAGLALCAYWAYLIVMSLSYRGG
jgi:hypothetical protein